MTLIEGLRRLPAGGGGEGLSARAFVTELPRPLAECSSPAWLVEGLRPDVEAPVERSDATRGKVRDLLRGAGYKPTGRGKPSSEYLARAANEGALQPINLLVDACNVVSLASGLPISVVDLDRARPPLRVDLAGEQSYVFNASGQEIRLLGLLCLFDAEGPCANAVKDSQRTKTSADTRRALSLIWSPASLDEHADRATAWYRELLERAGAETHPVG